MSTNLVRINAGEAGIRLLNVLLFSKTKRGDTALDIAKKSDWKRAIAALG